MSVSGMILKKPQTGNNYIKSTCIVYILTIQRNLLVSSIYLRYKEIYWCVIFVLLDSIWQNKTMVNW